MYRKKPGQMYFSPRGLRVRQRRQVSPLRFHSSPSLGDVSIALSHSEGLKDNLILRKGGKGGKWFTVPEDVSEAEIERLAKNFDKEWEARVGQYLDE
jgi:glutamate dehydrogenase/leucine dehydrogenase